MFYISLSCIISECGECKEKQTMGADLKTCINTKQSLNFLHETVFLTSHDTEDIEYCQLTCEMVSDHREGLLK